MSNTPDDPSPANPPLASPSAAENLRDIAEILPWVARGKNRFAPFGRPSCWSSRHPAELGLLIDQPLKREDARKFRRRAIRSHMLAFGIILLGRLIFFADFSSTVTSELIFPLVVISFMVTGGWTAVYAVTAITRGFLRSSHMTPARRKNATLLADYLVSPLAMFVLGIVTVPALAMSSRGSHWERADWALFGFLALLVAVWLCYLIVVVVAIHAITGRGGLRLALSATWMVLAWLLTATAMGLLTFILPMLITGVFFSRLCNVEP